MDVSLLEKVALFEGLTHAQLRKVAALTGTQRFEGGDQIFKDGDRGADMYVITEGKVRISKTVPGIGEEALAILEKGAYFGEMAIVDAGPEPTTRSADAIAHGGCEVMVIEREKLEALMFTDKDLAYVLLWNLVRTLSSRLRETNEKIKGFFAISRFG